MITADAQKKAAGEAAVSLVEDGMVVGLGTGSTAAHFVRALGVRAKAEKMTLQCVPTSLATETLARSLGLQVISLDIAGQIDLTVDGADEIGPNLSLIKGGGAALLREKLVWEASRFCVTIADEAKLVPVLGGFALPVEIIAFGHTTSALRLAAASATVGVQVDPRLRLKDGQPVQTDSGQVIYDLACGAIPDPYGLANAIKQVTGVVDHGLFLGLADLALVGGRDGVTRLARSPN
jgi:ribose 5-phosphate isomerase A